MLGTINRFQYTLDTGGEEIVDLKVTYWGGDDGRKFDILANGIRIGSEEFEAKHPGEFFQKRYSIPADVLAQFWNDF